MMMEAGIDWRNTSRQYSRAVFNTLSHRMFKVGSIQQRADIRVSISEAVSL